MDHQTMGGHESRRTFEQQTTIGETIRVRSESQPDQPAIVSSDYAPLSYRELQLLLDDLRRALRASGLSRSARIAIAMPNGPHAALAIVAVACSAVSIPLNPAQTLREIESSFASLAPDAVLLPKGSDSVVRRLADRLRIKILEVRSQEGSLGITIEEPQASIAAAPAEPDEPDPEAPAFILQTSGTTAKPKLIPTSHRNMLAAAARVQTWFDLTPQDRCLCVSPVFYAHGLHVMVFTPLLTGGSVAMPVDATRPNYSEWFEDLGPTWYSAGPTLHRMVLDQAKSKADARTAHSLRFVLSGGAPLPFDLLEDLQQTLGVPVVEHYGSSEGMQICSNRLKPNTFKLGTVGIPLPGVVIVTADDGSPLPAGERGEVWIGGPTVIAGYLNAPEITRACFVDGWFKSGDVGSIDEDGFLTLHGRKDDLINRGGEKISPLEIDEALLRHPAVAEAAAYSIPHLRLGQDVAAAVVLRPDMKVTPIELRRYLQDQLAPFKVPGQITIRDQLPKGKTGKILRRALADSSEQTAATEAATAAPALETTSETGFLVNQLTEIWERLLKVSPISIDDDFSEKGGDSLLALEMLHEVERVTGQTIPVSLLFEARTIRQLAQAASEQRIQPKPIVEYNSSGTLPPIFFFHGDYFGGLFDAKLASFLGADQPLFSLAPYDIGEGPLLVPIEEIAASNLRLIRNARPQGPYRLCGYCLGGLVAFEVARLLVAAGDDVEIVGMIDPPTISGRRYVQLLLSAIRAARPIAGPAVDRAAAIVWHKLSDLDRPLKYSIAERYASMKNKAQKSAPAGDSSAVDQPRIPGLTRSRLARIFTLRADDWHKSTEAMSVYSPKPVAVPVIYYAADYGSAAWRRMASDIATVKLSGNHTDAVRNPENLATIASDLSARLRARG